MSGVNYDESFSPVVRYSTLQLLIALSIKDNMSIIHLDTNTGFWNGL